MCVCVCVCVCVYVCVCGVCACVPMCVRACAGAQVCDGCGCVSPLSYYYLLVPPHPDMQAGAHRARSQQPAPAQVPLVAAAGLQGKARGAVRSAV